MNKQTKTILILSTLIGLLALLAAGLGVLWAGTADPFPITTVRGEAVLLSGHRLYTYDSVSIVAQAVAQDWVTLLLGIPLLGVSAWLFAQGRLRGQLLLTGTLGFFLYTYASYAFGSAYNELFLVYVALFSLSLFAFVLAMMSIDVVQLTDRFSERLPRRLIAGFLFLLGGFLLLAWLGRIVPGLLSGEPPLGLESNTTLFIQVLDLGLIVPVAFLTGVLLWRRRAWGYLLASIVLVKGFTLSISVSAMALNMLLSGVAISPVELVVFPTLTVIGIGCTAVLLKNVKPIPEWVHG